jgi:hypothetical protein
MFPYGDEAELSRDRHRIHAEITRPLERIKRQFSGVESPTGCFTALSPLNSPRWRRRRTRPSSPSAAGTVGCHGRAALQRVVRGRKGERPCRPDRSPGRTPEDDAQAWRAHGHRVRCRPLGGGQGAVATRARRRRIAGSDRGIEIKVFARAMPRPSVM